MLLTITGDDGRSPRSRPPWPVAVQPETRAV
eukprot:COSAG01_NODE_33966_length_555_cov_3.853070_1_plen_30_part_01